ncbi:MAG TPA: hypothetical protein VFY14_03655 [Streptomyces sp.]|nr:hypothetical protein [Streptomyces sp.]
MKLAARTALVLAGAGACAVILRRIASPPADTRRTDRWLVVTVNRSPTDVLSDGGPPAPLDQFGDDLEITVRPAPGDRGTELAARLRQPARPAASLLSRLAGRDPNRLLRLALREAKALLEAGEVLLPDAPPAARDQTAGGRGAGLAARRPGEEGVL